MINRIVTAAGIILAIYAVLASVLLYKAIAKSAEQEAAIGAYEERLTALSDARKGDAKVLGSRNAKRAARAPAEAGKRASMAAAAASNPEWADQPVPKEVQDALAD
jgi:hypothetical protein